MNFKALFKSINKKIHIPLIILFGSLGLISFINENESLKQLIDSFQNYHEKYTQEKVYLQTDKPYYAIGDDIWFKAYVVEAQTLTPTSVSNILFVDLIDSRDSIAKTLKVTLNVGFGWGNFELKDSLAEGNYRLRAYTNWMRNFDEGFFFDRTIKIGNAWTNQVITNTKYTFSKSDGKEILKADINYQNINGTPYREKEVTHFFDMEGAYPIKRKSKTDDNGNISIEYKSNKPFPTKLGGINTSLKIAESTIIEKHIPIKNSANAASVQFFPESGDLIENVRSKVAFKALGVDGLGKNISGYIVDQENNKIANFSSKHLGMGFFMLNPVAGKSYKAIINFEDGSTQTLNLPIAKTEGITLSVNSLSDSVLVKMSANKTFAEKNIDKEYTLIAQNAGNIVYSSKTKLRGTNLAAKLSKNRFMHGITQFTLFDEQLQPIAERLIFIAPKDTLSIQIKLDKKTHQPRGLSAIDVEVLDPNNKPVLGSFSMSVTDENKVPIHEDEESTIFSTLLLSSDIKGYIEKPNYYFHDTNEEKLRQLDVLMLTQGWRRFSWKNIRSNSFPAITFQPEKTLAISGKISIGKDKPISNGNLTLFTSGKDKMLIQTKSDQNGEFRFDSLYFTDSTKFVLQARTATGKKNVAIVIYNYPQKAGKNLNEADLTVNINQSMQSYLLNSKTQYESWLKNGIVNRSIILDEVKVIESKAKLENSSNLNGAGHADKVFSEKDLESATSLDQFLQGRVAGLQIINGQAFIRNSPNAAAIILDGMNVGPEFLSDINVNDIASVEILKSISNTAIYGSQGGSGVIIINTKRGIPDQAYRSYAPGILAFSPIGLFQPKEFYVPNYEAPETNKAIADLRTTIYWKPNIVTDSLGKAKVSFFNADDTGNYKVTIEGMDLKGNIARKIIHYQITPKP
jgi:TonB-dependent SusC/RagA subfamily outer membrane receptor